MEEDLENLLRNLSSDTARKNFLMQIYKRGDIEVSDRLISLGGDLSIIKQELDYASENGDDERFSSMAKGYIDHMVLESNHIFTLGEEIKKWKDWDLASYTLDKILLESEKKDPESSERWDALRLMSNIAESFGRDDVAKTYRENLLGLQDGKFKYAAANTLFQLERFDEAVDRLLSIGYITNAFKIAKEHSKSKVPEISRTVYDMYQERNGSIDEVTYLECAEELGKTDEAERTILEHYGKVEIKEYPNYHDDLVKSLVSLGHKNEALNLVERIDNFHNLSKAREDFIFPDKLSMLAKLYGFIIDKDNMVKGELDELDIRMKDKVSDLYSEVIKMRIERGEDNHNVRLDITDCLMITGDGDNFQRHEILLLEREGRYSFAATLAKQIGDSELADRYSNMSEMSSVAK